MIVAFLMPAEASRSFMIHLPSDWMGAGKLLSVLSSMLRQNYGHGF